MPRNLGRVRKIEDTYGLILFRTGLTHLIDVGVRHLGDENVTECIKRIEVEAKDDTEKIGVPLMTSEFQCDIIRCATELAKFDIWDIKKYIAVE